MKVILDITEKAINKVKAVMLIEGDIEEAAIDKAIIDWRWADAIDITDDILDMEEKEKIQIWMAFIAMAKQLNINKNE
jgi:hypothetical protein